jgi:antitoxin YefM
MSKEDYESLIETLELLSIPGFLASIKKAKREIAEGKTVPMEEVFKEG